MHNARDFAAAANGGGVRVLDANSNSKIDKGDVTKRRKWLAISRAISGKLLPMNRMLDT